jgi:hypothetical protein
MPPTTIDQPIIRSAAGVARAEHAADDHLSGDRDCIEEQREEDEQLERDLVRPDLGVAHPREDRRGDEKRRVQRGRPDEDLAADAHHRSHLLQARPARGRTRPKELTRERESHARLRDRRPRRRSGDPPVEAVHERQLEDDVEHVCDDDDLERAAQVGHSAQVALPAECDERRGQPHRGDAEVHERVVTGLSVPAECAQQRGAGRFADDEQREPDRKRRPERLRRQARRPIVVSGPGRARHDGGRSVREEVEDRERPGEDGSGEPERCELRAAEVADDRGVDEDVQRLGGERAERRQRQPQDLLVVRRAEAHRPPTIMAA